MLHVSCSFSGSTLCSKCALFQRTAYAQHTGVWLWMCMALLTNSCVGEMMRFTCIYICMTETSAKCFWWVLLGRFPLCTHYAKCKKERSFSVCMCVNMRWHCYMTEWRPTNRKKNTLLIYTIKENGKAIHSKFTATRNWQHICFHWVSIGQIIGSEAHDVAATAMFTVKTVFWLDAGVSLISLIHTLNYWFSNILLLNLKTVMNPPIQVLLKITHQKGIWNQRR